LFTLCLSLL